MRNDLIRAILNCGIDDLSILDDSEADMFKIVEKMRFEGGGAYLKRNCGRNLQGGHLPHGRGC